MDDSNTLNYILIIILVNTLLLIAIAGWLQSHTKAITRLVRVLIDAVNLINRK